MQKRALLQSVLLLVGCGYPEFTFSPDAAARPDTAAVAVPEVDPSIDSGTEARTVDSATAVDAPIDVPVDAPVDVDAPKPASCREIHEKLPLEKNGTFTIDPDGSGPIAPFPVFCEMTADAGGWTLALKVDGSKSTFAYDASYWTNDETLAPTSTNTDEIEAKMPSFSTVPFTQLRIGIAESGTKRFMVLNVTRASLKDAFTAGRISTVAGRDAWLKLLGSPILQPNCNDEGLNIEHAEGIAPRVRIGIIGNEQPDCATPDSYLGIGAGHLRTPACFATSPPPVVVGNLARMACGSDADRTTFGFAYVFVR